VIPSLGFLSSKTGERIVIGGAKTCNNMAADNLSYLEPILARKEAQQLREQIAHLPDDLSTWIT